MGRAATARQVSDLADTGTGGIVELGVSAGQSRPRPRDRRRRWLRLSFLTCVVAPVLAGALYFGLIASDRYVSGAGFAIRGLDSGAPLDGIGALTGLVSSGSTTSDSYIVLNYLVSRDLVERIDGEMPLRSIFGGAAADPVSRLQPDASAEELVDYWKTRITTRFDSASGLLTYEVEAFSPDEAQGIAALVLENTRALVNGLSEQARADALRFAEAEVVRAEARLAEALGALRQFRETERALNPAATAQLDMELVSELEARLAEVNTRIGSLAGRVDETAPGMVTLRREAEALRVQIADLGGAGPGSATLAELSGQLADFEALEVEKRFAEQNYASALVSLEQARKDADRQQRYLAVYSLPARPEDATYPRRVINILILAAAATAIWGVGTLVAYSVRDHVG